MKKTLLASVVAAAACLVAVPALADEPFTHDGFQFRGAVGPGFFSDSETWAPTNANISGGTFSLELYFGGTPVPGVTIGGFLTGMDVISPKLTLGGQTYNSANGVSVGLGQIGPYVDVYPDPHGGFHFLGGLTYASLSLNDGQGTSKQEGSGYGLNAGVGYDFWVSPTVSLGVLARVTYARTTLSQYANVNSPDATAAKVTVTDSMVAPSLLFSVSYQ
jgi:hypothetical protein